MGLEAVELVMAFQEEFEVKISDAEAEKMETVGKVVDFLYDHVKSLGELGEEMLGSIVDNRFRLAMGKSIHDFPWDKSIHTLIDDAVLHRHYRTLGVPGSVLPSKAWKRIHRLAWGTALVVFVASLSLVSFTIPKIAVAAGISLVALIIAYSFGYFSTDHLRCFEPITIQDLIDRRSNIRAGEITRQKVAQRVYKIVEEQLGVRPEESTMARTFSAILESTKRVSRVSHYHGRSM